MDFLEIAVHIRDAFIKYVTDEEAMGGPIDKDTINLVGLSEFLIERNQTDMPTYATTISQKLANTPQRFAEYLRNGLTPDALQEFVNTDFGKGVLLGSYIEYEATQAREDEKKALEEMENV
jgi:hypothetical protein